MFDIYLKYWNNGGTPSNPNLMNNDGSTETKVFSIPMETNRTPWLLNPVVKGELGKAETFDFTVNPGSEYYDAFLELKTLIRVEYDGVTIFYGRVLTVSQSGLLQVRSVHCEGIMAVLNDTPMEGIAEDKQTKITASQLFYNVINSHNSWIDAGIEPWKRIEVGDVNINFNDTAKKQMPTSWTTTLSELNKLVGSHGGYMRVRYYRNPNDGTEHNILDWKQKYFRDLGNGVRPRVEIAKNLLDLSIGSEVGEIFTRLIPIGATETTGGSTNSDGTRSKSTKSKTVYLPSKYICVKDIPSIEDDGFHNLNDYRKAESLYGIIYKTKSFSNAHNATQLAEYAWDWIKKNYYGSISSFSVKAIDLHMLGVAQNNIPQILVGDVVDVSYPEFTNTGTRTITTRKLVCKNAQYNLFNPEQNTYTFGVPCDEIDFDYGDKKTNKASVTQQANTTYSGGGKEDTTDLTFNDVYFYILYYYMTRKVTFISDKYTAVRNPTDGFSETHNPNGKHWTDFTNVTYSIDALNDYETPYFVRVNPSVFPTHDPAYSFKNNGFYLGNREDDAIAYRWFIADSSTSYTDGIPGGKFRDRVIGHYVYAGAAENFEYGVGIRDNAYAFTFNWYYMNGTTAGFSEDRCIPILFYFPANLLVKAKSANPMDAEEETTLSEHFQQRTAEDGTQQYYYIDPGTGKSAAETAAEIEAQTGSPVTSGKLSDGTWYVRLGYPVEVTLPDGSKQTMSGVVSEKDFHTTAIPSFNTNIAVIQDAIINKATVATLRAYSAALGADVLSTDYDLDDMGRVQYDPQTGKPKLSENANLLDSDAKFLLDNFDVYEYVYEKDKNGEYVTLPGTNTKLPKLEHGYKMENGKIMIDQATGLPIPNDPNDKPIYLLDVNGKKVLRRDADGNVIYQLRVGTHLQVNAQQYASVHGSFYYDENGNMVIRSGKGIKLDDNGASFGLWHKGQLTAGMFVTEDNGQTYNYIRGDNIYVGDGSTKRTLTQDQEVYGQVVGEYAWNYDANGNRTTVKGIAEGSGVWSTTKSRAMGLWHKGNLDAGMFVHRDENGETYNEIRGDHIFIGNGQNDVTIAECMEFRDAGSISVKKNMWLDGYDLYANSRNDGSNSSHGGLIQAHDFKVGVNGSLIFNDRTTPITIAYDNAKALMDTTKSHVKITGPDTNHKYTLWYAPAGHSVPIGSSTEGWIEAGNFSRAASQQSRWSGAETNQLLTVYAYPSSETLLNSDMSINSNVVLSTHTVGFSENLQPNVLLGVQETSELNYSPSSVQRGNKTYLKTKIDVVQITPGSGDDTDYTVRYRTGEMEFDATPVYSRGFDAGNANRGAWLQYIGSATYGTQNYTNQVDVQADLSPDSYYAPQYQNVDGTYTTLMDQWGRPIVWKTPQDANLYRGGYARFDGNVDSIPDNAGNVSYLSSYGTWYKIQAVYQAADGTWVDDIGPNQSLYVRTPSSQSADYTLSFGGTGTFDSSQSPDTVLSGWNPTRITGVPSSQQNKYRYIRFTVGSHKFSYYFS